MYHLWKLTDSECVMDGQTDLWTVRQMDRQKNGQTYGQSDRWADRKTDRHMDSHTGKWTIKQIYVQSDRHGQSDK